ncbi:hypothetical protein J2X03_002808 [Microbacterium trichothecenolyticum]|uniref:hypothetical protein n=1 Tax=Microbacterium trichothecenolyticum TaxID=69370 RepID=UPI0028656DEA|nr:hypothetical protein [Microbacterium trichothecenolyticum]MDR7112911.1 hypothetical protein [Microbacterium trichothecenolyticum]
METPKYLQVLWNYKWVLAFGALVAAVAAFFAGFAIVDGQVVSRAQQTWSAATTMLLTSESDRLYQAQVPGVPIEQGTSDPQVIDMSSTALVYAYILSSDIIQDAVEAEIGPLDDETESISALRRTTQPTGDERFPGRYNLPVLEAVGTAETADRAEEISRAAAAAFTTYVVAQQDAQQLAPELRVLLEPLGASPAVEGDSSNPAIPVVVTFVGVFLAFVVLVFVIAGLRSRSAKRKAARAETAAADAAEEPVSETDAAPLTPADVSDDIALDAEAGELVGAGPPSRRSGRAPREDETA